MATAPRCVFFKDESQSGPRVPRLGLGNDNKGQVSCLLARRYQKLDGHDISWSGILPPKFHLASRRCLKLDCSRKNSDFKQLPLGLETEQLADRFRRSAQISRFWAGQRFR